MRQDIKTKAAFAREVGVTRSRVSQWIAEGKLTGEALVVVGQTERIAADVAHRQLGRHVVSGSARGDTVEAIQRQRLAALELANERTRAAALADAGRYVEADAARREMGAIASRLTAAFDSAVLDMAEAIAAGSTLSSRDALHLLRTAWLSSRARLAETFGGNGATAK